jgi:hypothetical protein
MTAMPPARWHHLTSSTQVQVQVQVQVLTMLVLLKLKLGTAVVAVLLTVVEAAPVALELPLLALNGTAARSRLSWQSV